MISGDENVAPSLTPARPKALLKVYMTIRFGHPVAHSAILEVNHESIMGVTECRVTLS